MEKDWLQGWKGFLLGQPDDESVETLVNDRAEKICKKVKDECGINLDQSLVKVWTSDDKVTTEQCCSKWSDINLLKNWTVSIPGQHSLRLSDSVLETHRSWWLIVCYCTRMAWENSAFWHGLAWQVSLSHYSVRYISSHMTRAKVHSLVKWNIHLPNESQYRLRIEP